MPIQGREAELAAAAQAAVGAEERRLRIFRRSRLAVLVGAILVAAAATGIALGLTRGGSGRVTILPNSIAVIDPGTNRVVGDVSVGSRPVAVAVGAGGVWVANADDGTVSHIDPKTRRVVKVIGIGADLSDIAVGYGAVWVADGNDGTLTKIDPQQDAVETTLSFGGANQLAPQPIFSVATGGGGVWLTRGNRLLRIDPKTNATLIDIAIPPPVAIAVGAGAVWVVTQDERLLRLALDNGGQTGSLSLPTVSLSPTVGFGTLWMIVELGSGQIWRVDPTSVTPSGSTSFKGFPIEVKSGEGALWVANEAGTVQRVDPGGPDVVASIRVGHRPASVAAGEHGVWVAVQAVS
jgi:YVTN family beta-propeller protein